MSETENAVGTLYLAATPIGNLEDMTYRAVRVLGEVDVIAAEDTRHTRGLLTHFDIHTPLVSYHEHNKDAAGPPLIERLLAGENIACVSDAGLPGIADPGADLARRAIAAKTERESVSEELRVLYVAMTRARDRLVMTFAAKRLESKLQEIACRLPMDGGAGLCREADCPGDWVLTAAMGRTDAGELHALGGSPGQTRFDGHPWIIRVCQGVKRETDGTVLEECSTPLPPDSEEILRRGLSFQYPHEEATRAPSKQTATGKKGREKDEEAAENTRAKFLYPRPYRRPQNHAARPSWGGVRTASHEAVPSMRPCSICVLNAVLEKLGLPRKLPAL